jgi:hypothetical protein
MTVTSYQLSVTSYQLPVNSEQLPIPQSESGFTGLKD